MLEKGLSELNQLRDTLKMIPGSPHYVEVLGEGSDRIKLSWEPPKINPEVVEVYAVSKRIEGGGGAWKRSKGQRRQKH